VQKNDKGWLRGAVTDWGKVLIMLLDEAAVVVLVVLGLNFLKVNIPLSLAIPGAVLLGIFVIVVHIAVIPSFHRRQVTGREGMIGAQGTVAEPLAPVGTVTLLGERWKATSIDGRIEAGEDVEVVGVEGLTLKVKHKPQD